MLKRYLPYQTPEKNMLRLLLLIAATTFSLQALPIDFRPMDGSYALTAENYLDPAPDEARDSHLRMELTGRTAEDIYRAMKVSEETDVYTGQKMKAVGEMRCYAADGESGFRCDFAINIASQTIVYGLAC